MAARTQNIKLRLHAAKADRLLRQRINRIFRSIGANVITGGLIIFELDF